jgi:hypothetical protein
VETQISNKVIRDYEREKEKSKVARFKYLKQKADRKGSEIKKRDFEAKKTLESSQRKAENGEVAKRFKVVLKGLDNGLVSLKTAEEHEELERFYNPKKRGMPEALEIPAELSNHYLIMCFRC